MTNLLIRTFAKEDPGSPAGRAALGRLSGTVGILCNFLLFLSKLAVGAVSGSLSITADAMNNLTDATSSILTLVGFKLSEKPADDHHPYGHARYEYLSGLAVAVLILLIGFELAKNSVMKILSPTPVEFSLITGLVLVLSIGMKLWLALFNGRLGRLTGSTALEATAADSRNDCVSTGAVLLAGIIEHFTALPIDGFFGLGVAVFICVSGWKLARHTISPLLGEKTSPELRQCIVDYISADPRVLGHHDLMVHDYGPGQRFATIHVEMDSREDPMVCHGIIDDMERECLRSHGIHLVIHYDPVITDDPELIRVRTLVEELLASMDPRLRLHDFRMESRSGYTNLIFDVSLPAGLTEDQSRIRTALEEALFLREQRKYYAVITFDPESFNR